MKILHLTLKKKWFDLVKSGAKSEEYREIKPYWISRLSQDYDLVKFRNGYSKNAPEFTIQLIAISTGLGRTEWGAPAGERVFILELGKIITIQ